MQNSFTKVDETISKNICKFLNFNSLIKIILADLYNYFLFLNVGEKENEKLDILGFSSILIKFKYVSIALEKDLKEYKIKIYENLKQFGAIETNKYFKEYMRSVLIEEKTQIKSEYNNLKINPHQNPKQFDVKQPHKNQVENSIERNQPKNIFESEVKTIETKQPEKESSSGKGGIGSYLISALGFGPEAAEKFNKVNKPQETISNENNRPEGEGSRGEPEMFYDAQKKRWVLRGKIYEDDKPRSSIQEPVREAKPNIKNNYDSSATKNPPSKTTYIPPPKVKLTGSSITQSNQQNNPPKSEESNTTNISTPSKIANPFAANKPGSKLLVKPPQKPNLTNRYTSLVDYDK